MANIPNWTANGDWFDVCKCNIPCPCEFAQAPTTGDCDGILAWHIRKGAYGDVPLDGLTVVAVGHFDGNIWDGARIAMGIFIDERANAAQRAALQMIFGGEAGGWPAQFAKGIAEVRGIEFARIDFDVAGDLSSWRVSSPGKFEGRAEALTGPTTLPGQRVQTINPPGSEVGPGDHVVATWGVATTDQVSHYGFSWNRSGKSSKHIPFRWSGPS
jgi:hypothetical protein